MNQQEFDAGYQAAINAIKQALSSGNQGSSGGSSLHPDMKSIISPQQDQQGSSDSQRESQDKSQDQKESESRSGKSKDIDLRGEDKKKSPQIGDKGDKAKQEAEDVERRANAITDDAGDLIDDIEDAKQEAESEGNSKAVDKLDDVQKEVKDIKDKVEKAKNDAGLGGKRDRASGDPIKAAARVANIDKILKGIDDDNLLENAQKDFKDILDKYAKSLSEKELQEYKDNPLTKFKVSLDHFIKKETSIGRDKTWRRFNKNYSNSDGLIRKGTSRQVLGKIPLINVYYDVSGSFDDEAKTAAARQAVSTLNKFVKDGKIKMKVYYFADKVSETKDDAGSGTDGNKVLDHIAQTKPDNVIIITDDGFFYGRPKLNITVDGGVWFLFYDGRTEELINHLHGAKETKVFDIDY